MFAIHLQGTLTERDRFFYAKYTDLIAIGVHSRRLYIQNIEKWKFINTLVADIEHNVIIPNMYFKHLFNRLKKKIGLLDQVRQEVKKEIEEIKEAQGIVPERCERCCSQLHTIQKELLYNHQQILKHYTNMSLFIESLFRREHFEKGQLVLRPKRCFLEKEVIIPQLEHYAGRLRNAHISVERPQNMYEEEFPILVDIGLLAQVYANLFSNATKYTSEIIDHAGRRRKAMAYGREIVEDFLKIGQKGIKFNVFTTGPSMSVSQGTKLFLEGVRGEDITDIPGKGHGLSFIRHVVETHGGSVGYEPTPEGNNFYFILPLPSFLESPPTHRVPEE